MARFLPSNCLPQISHILGPEFLFLETELELASLVPLLAALVAPDALQGSIKFSCFIGVVGNDLKPSKLD